MDDFAQATVKQQLNEYQLLVAEILTGLDAEITAHRDRFQRLEELLQDPEKIGGRVRLDVDLESIHRGQRVLQLEVARLIARVDRLERHLNEQLANISTHLEQEYENS